ncbi:hypothetical protein E4U41_005997 [Claviceps citrina]|nr:hypothetical protein E4U41_005997 [Claviceps citrina]
MTGSFHEVAPDLPPPELPPPYEPATGDGDGDGDGDDDDDDDAREQGRGASEQNPFMSPYSDEKTPASPEGPGRGPSQSTSSKSASTSRKWSATPALVASILPSIPPGHAVLRTRCFPSAEPHHRLRVALATSSTLQVYDAVRDSLLWELHGNSSQLVQGDEEPLRFGEGFRPSPDGSLLCVVASRRDQRRLLVVDSETGWVRLEFALSATDGNKPHVSADNAMVVLCHSGVGAEDPGRRGGSGSGSGSRSGGGGDGYFKIFSLVELENHHPDRQKTHVRRIRFEKPAPWQAMGIRFAPDNKHIISCAGPARKAKDAAAPSISVCVYGIQEAGRPVRCTTLPCSPKFSSTSQTVDFAAGFHFPSPQEWLVSFPDYGSPGTTCIVNARLGQIVAVFSPQLSLSQKWQVGVSAPARAAQVAFDAETGIFTRMEASSTVLPRGQAVTVAKFALSANGGREKAVLRRALQIRAVVLGCKSGDVCALSPDGSYLLVQQQGSGGRVEVFSLAM